MRLQVMSDLHLSRGNLEPLVATSVDAVVLAGDIARPEQAIRWARRLSKPVLYVPGNHEFYGGDLAGVVRELRRLAEGSQVQILDNDECVLGGVRFLGSTLWTDFLLFGPNEERDAAAAEALVRMHDFHRIYLDEARQSLFSPLDSAALFRRNAAWLAQRLDARWEGPTVVVTHHAPSARSISARFRGSLLNACFASHADGLLGGERVRLWIHGHMHHSVDYVAQGTRVVCNPRGYARDGLDENLGFDPCLVVDVDRVASAPAATT
jgi:Icc-related predicted phosphoesterase